MSEVRRSPAPRFSDEAVRVGGSVLHVMEPRHARRYADDLARAVLEQRVVAREFDAACLSAHRSGRESAGRDLAERLRERANGAAKVDANPGAVRLCTGDRHDDRWCSDCAWLEMGMDLAADLIEQWAKAEEDA